MQGRAILFSLLLATAAPLGARADDDHGRHHDWHGGSHHDDHEGDHWAPDDGWHGGRHHGWHRGYHHDNHDVDHDWQRRNRYSYSYRPYPWRNYRYGRSWWFPSYDYDTDRY